MIFGQEEVPFLECKSSSDLGLRFQNERLFPLIHNRRIHRAAFLKPLADFFHRRWALLRPGVFLQMKMHQMKMHQVQTWQLQILGRDNLWCKEALKWKNQRSSTGSVSAVSFRQRQTRAVSDEEQESEADASQPHGAWRLLYAPAQHFGIGFSQLSVRL